MGPRVGAGRLPKGGTDATLNSVLVERQWDDNPEANTLLFPLWLLFSQFI